jgi:hypothetical protein
MNELRICESDSSRTNRSKVFLHKFEMRDLSQRISVILASREDHGLKLGNSQEMYEVY